jgi:hypothetical protein
VRRRDGASVGQIIWPYESFFFKAPDIAPRTVWACQSSAFTISSIVAPSGRFSMAIS